MMRGNHFYLIGWLVAATVLLSLAGLTAEPLQPLVFAMAPFHG